MPHSLGTGPMIPGSRGASLPGIADGEERDRLLALVKRLKDALVGLKLDREDNYQIVPGSPWKLVVDDAAYSEALAVLEVLNE